MLFRSGILVCLIAWGLQLTSLLENYPFYQVLIYGLAAGLSGCGFYDVIKAIGTRRPDCVTEIRMGNSVLVVSGYFKKDTTTTAADKMARVLEAEAAATQKPAI